MNCPTLFHPFNGWLHPLSFRTFLITFSWQWDKTLGTSKAIITRARKFNYVQFSQLGVVIEDSRWQLLYLVVTQFPRNKYSLISVKSVIFQKLLLSQVFYFIFPVGLTVYLCRARIKRLCYNPDVFVIFWYPSILSARRF